MRARTPAVPGLLILAAVLAMASPLRARSPGETGLEGVEEWEPSLEGGLSQQLFVRIAPAGSECEACGV